jgi:hypothetical protein
LDTFWPRELRIKAGPLTLYCLVRTQRNGHRDSSRSSAPVVPVDGLPT